MNTEPVRTITLDPGSLILNSLTLILGIGFLTFQFTAPTFAHGAQSPTVRLLLAENSSRAVVSGSSMIVERQTDAGFKPVISRIRLAVFTPVSGRIHLDGSDVVAPVYRVRSPKGLLEYNGRQYRGDLAVLAVQDRLMVTSHMSLETYLLGVVNGEIDSAWPMEAVKAQVVAARSYALYRVNARLPMYDLKPDVTDLVYAGVNSEDERAKMAVRSTRGQVLYQGGDLVQAFFHSSCGGTTISAAEVWGAGQPEQPAVHCGACEDAPYAQWNLALESAELARAVKTLSPGIDRVLSLGIHKRTTDGRVQTLFVETGGSRVLIDAGELRKTVGSERLRSTRFTLGRSGGKIVLAGEGYGHGVGLCQWGARGSAIRGMDYKQILKKYYPGVEVRNVY